MEPLDGRCVGDDIVVVEIHELRLIVPLTCGQERVDCPCSQFGAVLSEGLVVESLQTGPGWRDSDDDPAEEIRVAYLHRDDAVACSCAYAGLRPSDARAIAGPPDT